MTRVTKTPLHCPRSEVHKAVRTYHGYRGNGWNRIENYVFCIDCELMYKMRLEEVQ